MIRGYQEASNRTNRLFSFTFLYFCGLTNEEEKRLKDGKQKIVLSWGFLLVSCSFFLGEAQAQIVPDATLPVNSIVTPSGNTNIIDGGTRAGGNLFHSFGEFSVPTGGEAFFNNALDVQNIFSRVTGRSISNIDGLIRANGTANLFLLNPNGIIFGPNARLNIGGSFLASTASSIKFGDGVEFSATATQSSPLLTISVPVGLQMGPTPGNIVLQGSGHNLDLVPTKASPIIINDNRPVGLQVAPGQTLALLGGNIALEGGNLTAEGGRIELGSVGGDTLVTLTRINQGMALSYPDIENFQDISLSRAASVDATGAGGGDVFVVGRRVMLTDGSAILALTEGAKAGGTLSVRALEVVEVIGRTPDGLFFSGLFADVQPGSTKEGGDLTIETARLQVADGARISASTFGSGKAGNLTVKATDTVELIGTAEVPLGTFFTLGSSGLYTSGSTGDGGNVMIETGRLTLKDGARISTSILGQGKAGDLTIKASDAIEVIGNSRLYASALFYSNGDGGNVTIETGRLTLKDTAYITTFTFGQGKAGNLTVKASNVIELIGDTGLSTSGFIGEGSGNVTIETERLTLKDRAFISTATSGQGKAGNLTVKASNAIELIGNNIGLLSATGLYTTAGLGSTGDGGNVTIETGRLTLKDTAYITTSTLGQGKAGNVTIETEQLTLKDGGIFTITYGQGKAGNLTVKASKAIELIGDLGLYAEAERGSKGDGGNLTIETARLQVTDGAKVTVRSAGEGKAGNLIVNADSILLENSSSLTADTKAGGGSIELRSPSITLRGGSRITTNATGGESGGNITVNNSQFLQLRNGSRITTDAEGENVIGGNINLNADIIVGLENSDITANSKNSQGGNITINTQGIFGLQARTREELQNIFNTDHLDPRNLPTSDITATGATTSSSGTVAINISEVNPTSGLLDLPANPVDATSLVASTCRPRGGEQGEFIFTGRGGLPPSPNELIRNEATWMDLREIALSEDSRAGEQRSNPTEENQELTSIVEAQGWMKNAQGQVVLVAQTATATSQKSTFIPEYCHE